MTTRPAHSTLSAASTTQSDNEAEKRTVPSRPYFSVILCTYNRCRLVLSALASLRRQTLSYDQFEVIVVDNGSSDGTLSMVHRYVNASADQHRPPADIWRVHCLRESRHGLAHARNRALQTASGEIAVFLDDDALADPHYLEQLQAAYQESAADAIGGCVNLHWEAPRPHWLTDDLLPLLGYFFPSNESGPLPDSLSLSSCNFSVKMEVLRSLGFFSALIGGRSISFHTPTSLESEHFCHRLRQAGYRIWYTPSALVTHRVPAPRLQRAFFTGRAYWQGRAEILAHYTRNTEDNAGKAPSFTHLLRAIYGELLQLARLSLFHRPLLALASTSSIEQLQALMAHARVWGHVRQLLEFVEHAPITTTTPSLLLVCPADHDCAPVSLLKQALSAQDVHALFSIEDIPLPWLWRHRSHLGRPIAIVHIYQPGAFQLNQWQQQRFCILLWLAQLLGIRIVTTDAGGWWQNVRSLRFLSRRLFERRLLACSNLILTHTRHPDKIYPDKKLQSRTRYLRHPGFRGHYPSPIPAPEARAQLGLPQDSRFVYLCLARMHSEREIKYLIDAFFDVQARWLQTDHLPSIALFPPQLLLVGEPREQKYSFALLKQAALNSAIHLFMEEAEDKFPLYIGATDALVLPHFALPAAGILTTAVVALSYERVIIAPDLPRFQGQLPAHASVFYDPSSRSSLTQALYDAQSHKYILTPKGLTALDAERGWQQYGQQLVEIYKQLLFS